MSHDQDDLVLLRSVATAFEAHTLVAVLHEHGLDACVYDASATGFGIPGHSEVMVRSREVARARRILDQQIADSVDLDWDEVQLGEREDDLPLQRPGRMPVWARGGMIVAILLVLVFLVSLLFSIL